MLAAAAWRCSCSGDSPGAGLGQPGHHRHRRRRRLCWRRWPWSSWLPRRDAGSARCWVTIFRTSSLVSMCGMGATSGYLLCPRIIPSRPAGCPLSLGLTTFGALGPGQQLAAPTRLGPGGGRGRRVWRDSRLVRDRADGRWTPTSVVGGACFCTVSRFLVAASPPGPPGSRPSPRQTPAAPAALFQTPGQVRRRRRWPCWSPSSPRPAAPGPRRSPRSPAPSWPAAG